MLHAYARAIRRGRNADPDLVRAAAEREMQFQAELMADLHLVAAEPGSQYGDDTAAQGANS